MTRPKWMAEAEERTRGAIQPVAEQCDVCGRRVPLGTCSFDRHEGLLCRECLTRRELDEPDER